MIWDELSEEERIEWRKSPVTMAFIDMLAIHEAEVGSELEAACVRDESTRHEIARIAGRQAGLREAIRLMEES